MVEQLTANFSQQTVAAKGLTVQLHGAQYLSDHGVCAIKGEQFKSYIKAEFSLNSIPRSAVLVLKHLQQGSSNALINISVNGIVIMDNFHASGRGGSRIFRRGFLLVVEQVCGGLGAVPPDARKVLIE